MSGNITCFAYFKIKVAGKWGKWTSWSRCQGDCGGSQRRVRTCDEPAPRNGGPDCDGELFQTEERNCAKCQDNSDRDPAPQGRFVCIYFLLLNYLSGLNILFSRKK